MSGALRGVDVCVQYPYVEDVTHILFLYYVSDVVAYPVTIYPTITHCVLHRGVSIAIRLRRIVCYHLRPCVFVRKYRGDVEPLRDRGVKKIIIRWINHARLNASVSYQPLPPAGTSPISLRSQGQKRLPRHCVFI